MDFKKILFVAFLLLFACLLPAYSQQNRVVVARVDGVIDPAVSSYLVKAIEFSEERNLPLIILLDTPGGLDTSMREIVKAILNSKIPVIVYVYPKGARAASAGCFIAAASHFAAMSPGTSIGAAHPVNFLGGEATENTAMQKAVNDAVSYLKSICEKRNRNPQWAEKAVRKSVSLTETEALNENVIDAVSENMNELLKQLNGRKFEVQRGKLYRLDTADAQLINYEMNLATRLLHLLSNPTLVYLMLLIGFYGLIYEFSNPGIGFAGIGGAICIILSLYGMHTLSASYAALALIVLGIVLFVAEAYTPTFGVLAGGGLISFILGSIFLFERSVSFTRTFITTVVVMAVLTLIFILFTVSLAVKARKAKVTTGKEGMIGLKGVARTRLEPHGKVFVRGELWNAESLGGPVEEGEEVEVVEVEGLKLKVRKVS